VWFSYSEGGAPALGTVTYSNGTPIPLDQAVTLGSLTGLTYTGSATHGTDEIWLKAFNGSWDPTWVRADITDPGITAPVVTANQPERYLQPINCADEHLLPRRQWNHAVSDLVQLASRWSACAWHSDVQQRHADPA
jgi:hypothetical protein